jgi:hypothetical protein
MGASDSIGLPLQKAIVTSGKKKKREVNRKMDHQPIRVNAGLTKKGMMLPVLIRQPKIDCTST